MTRKRNPEPNIVVSTGATPARALRKTLRAKPVTAPAAAADPAEAAIRPTHDEIARLAYSYWEARGHQGGSPEEDWVRAEQELLSQQAASATA